MIQSVKFRYAPWVLWMTLIFYGSHQEVDPTLPPPDWIPQFILEFMKIQHADKVMHIIEYFILGTLGVIADKNHKIRVYFIGVFFAVSDEIHQSFIPGRFADIYDVCADIIGLSIATFIAGKYISKLLKKKGDSI